MNLFFLGTSAGVPTKTRNVTAIAVREAKGKAWYLVDCGEGTQHQILHTKLSIHHLQAIFITHVHGDHCYGLPGILASAAMSGRKEPLKIIAPAGIKEWLEATQVNTALYFGYKIEFMKPDMITMIEFPNLAVISGALSHRVPSYAYAFVEKNAGSILNTNKLIDEGIPEGPLWGRLKKGEDIEHHGQIIKSDDYLQHNSKPGKIVIAGDNDTPDLLQKLCADANVLVHEATYTKDIGMNKGKEVGHSYAELVGQFAQSIQLPNLVLTHFSPRYQDNVRRSPSINDIYAEARNVYSGKLFLAKDFNQYHLNKTGALVEVLPV